MFIRFKFVLVYFLVLLLSACGGGIVPYGVELSNNDGKIVISDDVRPLPFHSKINFTVPNVSLGSSFHIVNTGLVNESDIPIVVSDIEALFRINRLFFDTEWKIEVVTSSSSVQYLYLFSEEVTQAEGDYGMVIYDNNQNILFSTAEKYFNPISFIELNITELQLSNSFSDFITNGNNNSDIVIPFSNNVGLGMKLGASLPFVATAAIGGNDLFIFNSTFRKISGSNSSIALGWGLDTIIPGAQAAGGGGVYPSSDLTQSIPLIDLSLYD